MNRHLRAILSAPFLFFVPGTVFAHAMVTGVSPFMGGLMYSIFVPAHLICLIAIGLFIGQQEPNRNLTALLIYPVATVIGLLVAEFNLATRLEIAILVTALTIGLLVVISPKLSATWCAITAAFCGFILGLDSALQTQQWLIEIKAMLGASLGIVLLPLLVMEFSDFFRKRYWQRIGIRIVGSWIAASAFIVLALTFAPAKI